MTAAAVGLMLGLFALGLPIAIALGVLALALLWMFSTLPLDRALGEVAWSTANEFLLFAVPLYILMGELLLRSGVAMRMYGAMVTWLAWLPGGLMHSNIGACAMFAATSGSSVATAATIGTVALPQQKAHGYNERLFLGTVAAGGTLGILIPPSINMVIYALLAEQSIPQLYMASFIPGLLMAMLFALTIVVCCMIRPEWGGKRITVTWEQRIACLPDLLPPLGLFLVVIGSIYAGWATPTESAALGVMAALGLAAARRALSFAMLRQAFEGTLRILGMTMFIVVASYFLNFVLSAVGITDAVVRWVDGLGLTPMQTILAVCALYIVLGALMDELAMLVTTAPFIVPIVIAEGFDPVWFGVLMMVLSQLGMIAPPVGINLFVVQSVRRGGSLTDVIVGSAPFMLTLLLMTGLLIAFLQIALWLPQALRG
jgi:tripartite ATP-independent transporter DctM subunit